MKVKTRMQRIAEAIHQTETCLGKQENVGAEAVLLTQDLNGTPISEDNAILAAQISRERAKDSRHRKVVKAESK